MKTGGNGSPLADNCLKEVSPTAWASSCRYSDRTGDLWGRDDWLAQVGPILAMVQDWRGLLDSATSEDELRGLRSHAEPVGPWVTMAS